MAYKTPLQAYPQPRPDGRSRRRKPLSAIVALRCVITPEMATGTARPPGPRDRHPGSGFSREGDRS